MPRTITFQPSDKMASFIESLVDSGDFNNQSEVIRASIRLLEEQTAESKLKQLRDLIEEGDSSGDPIYWSADAFLERIKKQTND